MNTERITREALKNKFRKFNENISLTGVTFAHVTYANDVSGSKVVKGQHQLQKVVDVTITVGSKYQDKIQRLTGNEKFESATNWFFYKYGVENPVVASKKDDGKEYLVMIVENHTKRKTKYFHCGVEITIPEAKEGGLLRDSFFSKKKTAGRGSVSENEDFDFNVLSFDNIVSITLNKTLYIVEN